MQHVRKRKGAYSVLVETPEVKRLLGRTSRRWQDIIKMSLQEMGISGFKKKCGGFF